MKAKDDAESRESLRVMLKAVGEEGQIDAIFSCGRVLFRKVLPNGFIVRLQVTAPGQSRKKRRS